MSGTSEKITFDDFHYVIEVASGQNICFGSTVPRSTAPIGSGLSPFQKIIAPEWFKTSPGYYDIEKYTSCLYPVLFKIRSKKGVGPLASETRRFEEKISLRTPSPGRYDVIRERPCEESRAPFGTRSRIKFQPNKNPGPATYDTRQTKKCRKLKKATGIETICVQTPFHTCEKCEKLCEGDYWQMDYSTFLCHLCWEEEKHLQEMHNVKTLKRFKKIRNCSFMHSHEGTTAAIRTLPPKKVKQKLRLEKYLDLYIQC
ncbi:uncharacterized protein LOC132704800 isoform X2 [Cylas formicarius]|uniref:uncharacterized protein LOC132704800 isoform X2 n=1 Tax=Cylas formicarius TaxID=197179 RepID=UPI00295888DB|nr:uncharacterized protein LOC132704800 isoform X2 [Cylas formicarius]